MHRNNNRRRIADKLKIILQYVRLWLCLCETTTVVITKWNIIIIIIIVILLFYAPCRALVFVVRWFVGTIRRGIRKIVRPIRLVVCGAVKNNCNNNKAHLIVPRRLRTPPPPSQLQLQPKSPVIRHNFAIGLKRIAYYIGLDWIGYTREQSSKHQLQYLLPYVNVIHWLHQFCPGVVAKSIPPWMMWWSMVNFIFCISLHCLIITCRHNFAIVATVAEKVGNALSDQW